MCILGQTYHEYGHKHLTIDSKTYLFLNEREVLSSETNKRDSFVFAAKVASKMSLKVLLTSILRGLKLTTVNHETNKNKFHRDLFRDCVYIKRSVSRLRIHQKKCGGKKPVI